MYVSIDIETGGLDMDCDILQVAAVKWDAQKVNDCSAIDIVIKQDLMLLEPYAARMNAGLIDVIATGKDHRLLEQEEAWEVLSSWLGDEKVFAIGKNASMFDLPFLTQHGFPVKDHFKHRVLDVGCLYATPAGIPSLPEILASVGTIGEEVTGELHDALYDAKVTLALAKLALQGKGNPQSALGES